MVKIQSRFSIGCFWFFFEILHCIQCIHSITFIKYIHPSPFAEVPLHFLIAGQFSGQNLPWVPSRESMSGLPYSKPTYYQLSFAAPYLATPHPTELHRTLLSYAALYWVTPHPLSYAANSELRRTLMSYVAQLRRTLLSYAAPFWSTPYPSDKHRTLVRYAKPYWATPHCTELCRSLLSYAAPYWYIPHYAAPFWATPHSTELRLTLLSYAAPYWTTPHPFDITNEFFRMACLPRILVILV